MKLLARSTSFSWCLLLCSIFCDTSQAFIPIRRLSDQQPLKAADPQPKQIAIIGAGSAGASTAYNLQKDAIAHGIPVNITVFERESYVGGRSTTVDVFDNPAYPVEIGGSIFVSVNYNLINASRELGLDIQGSSYDRPKESSDAIGVWDGTDFVLRSGTGSWWDIGKIIWRYGLAPIRTRNSMKTTVNKFLQIYDQPLFPFKSLTAVAASVGLLDATSTTGSAFLKKNNIGDDFAREVIQGSTRVNYGQNVPLIHGLETMVCMATDGAVSVTGGNWQIFDGMLKLAGANLRLNHTVTSITRNKNSGVTLKFKDQGVKAEQQADFDEVVIAGPYQYSGLNISPEPQHVPDTVPFVRLYVTHFATPHRLSSKYFKLSPSDIAPETIITTLPKGVDLGDAEDGEGPAGFWSISTIRTVHVPPTSPDSEPERHYVYKIFTRSRPSATFIRDILGLEDPGSGSEADDISALSRSDISWHHEKIWNPYPYLYPRVTFEDPLLAPGIWYTGGIESFISTMETSALMGKNVAALMSQSWLDQDEDGEVKGLEDSPVDGEL